MMLADLTADAANYAELSPILLVTGGVVQFVIQHIMTRATRESDRRKTEEGVTDVILKRVSDELARAYTVIDRQSKHIQEFEHWLQANQSKLRRLGINSFPDGWDDGDAQMLGEVNL